MTETSPTHCKRCESLSPETVGGLCPRCLMALNFDSQTMPQGEGLPPQKEALPPEEIADKFPQFEILECLGRGGMGVVYKARQKSLNRLVAIKILAPERESESHFSERFAHEAELLAKLNHPHIVTIHDFGETDGLYYLVMEYVDGVNLRDLLRDGKLEAKQALAIVPPVCEALQYAHDKGIVHRDIKPENLLVDREGGIKIADFGIAFLVGATSETSGTPPYMAPEQGTPSEVDHRADIYALGVVLYEMLTGERPTSPLNLPSQKVSLDIRIDDIVLRALNKEPELRYRTANEFRTVVENVTPETNVAEPPPAGVSQTVAKPIDPRVGKILGILLIVLGALNGLSTLVSLLVIPVLPRLGLEGFGPTGTHVLRGFGGAPMMLLSPEVLFVISAFSIVYTLVVSTLCIIGGIQMCQRKSRAWALIGAIACCLTPLWWPLGLIVGIGTIILFVLEKDSLQPLRVGGDVGQSLEAKKQGPRLSAMAVVAFSFQVFLVFGLLLLLLLNA
ncbi:MAG: serine/threonine-protein kinase [Roseibacillus sp.]